MIVREILKDPTIPFDFYNDASDTISWLRRQVTSEATAIADDLSARYRAWIKDYQERASRNILK